MSVARDVLFGSHTGSSRGVADLRHVELVLCGFSGEIKGGATRKQWYAMLWATLIQYSIFIVMTLLLYKTVGQQFIASVNFLSTANPAAYALPAPPYLVLLTSVIPGGFILPFIISFSFIAWVPLVHFIQFIQAIRAHFAMAFDRVLRLSWGRERAHTCPDHEPDRLFNYWACLLDLGCLLKQFHDSDRHRRAFRHPVITLVGISAVVFPYR